MPDSASSFSPGAAAAAAAAPSNTKTYDLVIIGCGAAGVQAEIDNVAIYDELFKLDLPSDTRAVFENLQRASLEKHLPAFKRCA